MCLPNKKYKLCQLLNTCLVYSVAHIDELQDIPCMLLELCIFLHQITNIGEDVCAVLDNFHMIVPLLENILSNFEIFQYTKEIRVVRVLILPVHNEDGCFLPILGCVSFPGSFEYLETSGYCQVTQICLNLQQVLQASSFLIKHIRFHKWAFK